MAGIDTLVLVLAAPAAVAIAKAVVEFLRSWMTKKGSEIEIRIGDRVISTINSGQDKSKISELIQTALSKDVTDRKLGK